MTEQNMPACPKWVNDESLIKTLLNNLIDKLERDVKPHLRINSKTMPQLYHFNSEDTHHLWALVTSLANHYHIISIKLQRSKSGKEVYENAYITLNTEHECVVRQWLDRPSSDAYLVEWKKSVEHYSHIFQDKTPLLSAQPIHHPDKSPEQIINGLSLIKNQLTKPLSLRSLSAKCFGGDSKFLDKREDWVKAIFPALFKNIIVRPLLINVCVADEFTQVLFVENQDSFLMLADYMNNITSTQDSMLNKITLVYSSGFRGAASRIRQPECTVFSHLTNPDQTSVNQFEQWWFSSVDHTIPCYFWGDLDFSGFAILAALKKVFKNIQAWRPGYNLMVNYHQQGIHHSVVSTRKENQKDPGNTQCEYTDNTLLPLLRNSERFLDQEIVDINSLITRQP